MLTTIARSRYAIAAWPSGFRDRLSCREPILLAPIIKVTLAGHPGLTDHLTTLRGWVLRCRTVTVATRPAAADVTEVAMPQLLTAALTG